ncbi:MAG: OmpA family protein, partial [Bacteroidales bacterium]
NEANPIKKYLHLSEKVKGKYHPSDYKIREVRHDTSEWFDISMVLDHSGSMYGIIGILQQATSEFIKYKFPSDQISLVKFDHHIKTVSPLQSNKKEILDSLNLNGLQNFGGNTALYASIDQGIINLHQGRENKVLVAFTDGKENASFFYVGNRAYTAKQLAKKMKNKDIKLFIVSFGSFVDNKLLETLADVCGGKHYNIRRKNQIINVFKELPRIFRYYYEVTFRPESYKGEHQIHLTMTTPDGSIIQGKKSFFTGDDYTLFESASIPLYLLKEIPVRADILLNSPQVLARFDFDKHHLKTKYYPVVKSLLNYMKSSPEVKVLLAGHTDMIGSASYCLDLSRERAAEVKQYLAERGIEKSRIKTKACGKRHPVYKPEENEQEAKRNRRVEAVLYTD